MSWFWEFIGVASHDKLVAMEGALHELRTNAARDQDVILQHVKTRTMQIRGEISARHDVLTEKLSDLERTRSALDKNLSQRTETIRKQCEENKASLLTVLSSLGGLGASQDSFASNLSDITKSLLQIMKDMDAIGNKLRTLTERTNTLSTDVCNAVEKSKEELAAGSATQEKAITEKLQAIREIVANSDNMAVLKVVEEMGRDVGLMSEIIKTGIVNGLLNEISEELEGFVQTVGPHIAKPATSANRKEANPDIEKTDERTWSQCCTEAERGDVLAQFTLAQCYEYGIGITPDQPLAFHWYKKAAQKGHVESQYNVAYCYEYGQGVGKNQSYAVRWYEKAANQGNAAAQYCLGLCYEYGHGVDSNKKKAIKLYREAAKRGDKKAIKRLKEFNLL